MALSRKPRLSHPSPTDEIFSLKYAGVLFLFSILLCWPMLIVSTPLVFYDSVSYFGQGLQIAEFAEAQLVKIFGSEMAAGAAIGENASGGRALRSVPYAMMAYFGSLTPLGFAGAAILQTYLVVLMVAALVGRIPAQQRVRAFWLAAGCCFLTSLPWFASYLMPDLLAAAIVLYAALLVSRFDEMSLPQQLVAAVIMVIAIVCHYGHVLLAVGSVGAALGLRLVLWRLSGRAVVFGLAPIVAALIANALFGLLAFDSTSVAPKRLPVLLARSLEDGPARWHLQEHCGTYQYEICQILGEIPDTVSGLLFEDSGLRKATAEQLDKVRAEEPVILMRSFMEYPVDQVWSMLGNSVDQLVSFGYEDFAWAEVSRGPDGEMVAQFDFENSRQMFIGLNVAHVAIVALAALAIAYLIITDAGVRRSKAIEIVLVVLAAIVVNAVIFGGLSEPADRYQTRIVWIIPVLACLFWLRSRRGRAIS